MSKRLGDALPDGLFRSLSGRDLAAVADRVIVVCGVDERGFPHPALLSCFEVVALDPGTIRLAMYATSRTTGNARREGRLTLIAVDGGVAYYIKGAVRQIREAMRAAPYNAVLQVDVADVLADEADPEREPGAYLSSGITYVNPRRAEELERARRVVAELRE